MEESNLGKENDPGCLLEEEGGSCYIWSGHCCWFLVAVCILLGLPGICFVKNCGGVLIDWLAVHFHLQTTIKRCNYLMGFSDVGHHQKDTFMAKNEGGGTKVFFRCRKK